MTNEKGETFFVGKDVAEALGYKNPQKALRDHVDEEDKTLNVSFTVNGTAPIIIKEQGDWYLFHLGTCRKVCPLFCRLNSIFYRTPIN